MIKLEGALYPWRFRVVLALLALLVGAIACQIIYLQVIDHDFLKGQGDARSVRQRLKQFAAARQPEKDKLINASRQSYLWYERMGEWMRKYSTAEFVHAYMKRTGRMSDERLWRDYPQMMEAMARQGVVERVAAP